MNSTTIFRPHRFRDPKLAIKSSMPRLKEGISWLILFHLISKNVITSEQTIKPFEEYVDQENKTRIRLTTEIREKILDIYIKAGLKDQTIISELQDRFDRCALASAQIESMIVAYEIFLQLAECHFDSSDVRPKSVERTGGERFSKFFKLTSAVRHLSYPIKFAPEAFLLLMLKWISDKDFSSQDPIRSSMNLIEIQLKEQIFDLSARMIFRFEDEDSSKPDYFFNILGLYRTLIRGTIVKLASNREDKGPLRILKNAISNDLLPGLKFKQNEFLLDKNANLEYLRALIAERENFEILSAIDATANLHSNSKLPEDTKTLSPMRNVILYGVPGSGKSFKINEEHLQDGDFVERVVFHPEYMYANFIGQILPIADNDTVNYRFIPGPFTGILQRAIMNPQQRHVLIIEEINRGNAAAIFGDVFQLLDRDEFGTSRYGIHNRDIGEFIHANPEAEIKIPPNLALLATMNTSDQNVFTLDTAFQRRWSMEIVPNDLTKVPWAQTPISGTPVTWRTFVNEINRLIIASSDSFASSEDKRLGAFFVSEQELLAEEAQVFAEKVLKYLWDDAFKFSRGQIFRDADSRTLEEVIQAFVRASPEKRWDAVFTSKLTTQLLPLKDSMKPTGDTEMRTDGAVDGNE